MAKAMTKSQIVAAIAESAGISKKQAGAALEALAALAYKNAKNGFTIPVLISGPDYAQKRFKEGQIVKVKYHAASGKATLSGELNWRIIFSLVFFGVLAVIFWIAGYRAEPKT